MPEALAAKLLAFYHINPAASLFFLACGLTVFRKIMKHRAGTAQLKLQDLKKYPSEAMELLLILMALFGSVYYFLKG